MLNAIESRISQELDVATKQVVAAVQLLDDGSTVPFVARYRKEITGGLDDTQLRNLEDRLNYLRELEERRSTVINSIKEQQKLTPELEKLILLADNKTSLEDLYRPYMPKRRTKAQIAKEAGLDPLADKLLSNPNCEPNTAAKPFINKEKNIATETQALDGARQILMEKFAEDAQLLATLRETIWDTWYLKALVVKGKQQEGSKFSDYFDYCEPLKSIPSHRALALFRGQNEGVLQLKIAGNCDNQQQSQEFNSLESKIAQYFNIADQGRNADTWLIETVHWAWRIKLSTHLDIDAKKRLRQIAEQDAIGVFAQNIKHLLMAAPAGQKVTLGLDPGIRTGVKVAVVDATGKLLDTNTIYPHEPKNRWDNSIQTLVNIIEKYQVQLIAIGNGTASRETEKLVADLMHKHPSFRVTKVMVSEAGASVYSASELAANEFPNVDVSLRGAISIARRLQDPLAELVKISPKSIGVGQYQHDVNQIKLERCLGNVVEDCVNAVGVDLNTASPALLNRVAGLSTTLASNIVAYRDQHGAFENRTKLLEVPRLGPKAFEQCAGFLRIGNGDNPLDRSAVHPEAYPVIQQIIDTTGRDIRSLIGDAKFLKTVSAEKFTSEKFGIPTVKDILSELEKPGRDPRPEFKTAQFKEGVNSIKDLKEGMRLQGVVTNVTNFGAFVDVGVHQDGLVHVSNLSDQFVSDPHKVVKTGEIVSVSVIEVDLQRQRIALSMRNVERAAVSNKKTSASKKKKNSNREKTEPQTAMAIALSKLKTS